MAFKLPPLPYDTNALSPHISKETLEYHYGRHHRNYVDKLNQALEENEALRDESLETILLNSKGAIFNNAAQVWNHSFLWNCMAPRGGGAPAGALGESLKQHFDSFEKFKTEFTQKAAAHFGSGYAWLVKNREGSLVVQVTHDAENPLTQGHRPLLTCDLWEHAYYLDYRHERAKYLEAFWKVVNWNFVQSQLQGDKEPAAILQS